MARPTKVRIGPHDIAIKFTEHLLYDGEQVLGLYENHKSLIQVSTQQSDSMMADSLLHEIIHAVHYIQIGISMKEEELTIKEEQLTTLTATSLCQVFKDSPNVINWILNNL